MICFVNIHAGDNNPNVNEVTEYIYKLKFYGNQQISDERLARASDLRKFHPYSKEILNRGLIQLRDYYLMNGLPLPRFRTNITDTSSGGAVGVYVYIREAELPMAESLDYRITGYPGILWKLRLNSVFGWYKWKAGHKGLNIESLKKLSRKEENLLRENGYRNAEIKVHQEPGENEHQPRVLIEIMVKKPVKLKFENIAFLTRRDLMSEWGKKHTLLTERELNQLVSRTKKRLLKKGWLDAEVNSETIESEQKIVAHIQAHKQSRRFIKSIDVTGQSPVKTKNIGKITGIYPPRLFGLWKTRPDQITLEKAEKALLTHLESLGYMNAECDVNILSDDNEGVVVVLDSHMGPKRTIGKITFDGANGFTRDQLMEAVKILPGDPFVRNQLKSAMKQLTKLYWEYGYTDVSMKIKTRQKGSKIDVTFFIVEGINYVQGPLILKGNVKTKSKLIYQLEKIVTGNPFNLELLGKLQEAMYKTGVFESVNIRTEEHPDESPPYQTAYINVIERSTGVFEAGIDFNTDRGVDCTLELGERNLFGEALFGKASVLIGQERWFTSASLGRPLLFGYPLQNRIRVTASDDRTNSGYNLKIYETELRTIWNFQDNLTLSIAYAFEKEDLSNVDSDIEDEIDIKDTKAGSITPVLTVDRRNDPFRSTRGWYFQTRLKNSFAELGSEAEFIRWDNDLRMFYPLSNDGDLVIGGALRFGRSWTLGDSVLPAGERFFAGGASSNRGFEHKKCGPRTEDGDPLGGMSYILANLELRFHIAGSLHGAIFTDIGNVYIDTPEAPYLRTSAGLGLRYETLIGPFRADFGFNLNPGESEPDYVLQIALGHAF